MGSSNDEWANFSDDPDAARRWDEYVALPELPEDHAGLNAFMESRGLERADLMRVGAKWGVLNGRQALVYIFG